MGPPQLGSQFCRLRSQANAAHTSTHTPTPAPPHLHTHTHTHTRTHTPAPTHPHPHPHLHTHPHTHTPPHPHPHPHPLTHTRTHTPAPVPAPLHHCTKWYQAAAGAQGTPGCSRQGCCPARDSGLAADSAAIQLCTNSLGKRTLASHLPSPHLPRNC